MRHGIETILFAVLQVREKEKGEVAIIAVSADRGRGRGAIGANFNDRKSWPSPLILVAILPHQKNWLWLKYELSTEHDKLISVTIGSPLLL
jgi:hypothetical protein